MCIKGEPMNQANKQNKQSKRQKEALALKIKRAKEGKPEISKFRQKHPKKNIVGINSPFSGEK